MSEIEFLTYPVKFKWTERDFKTILFPVNLIVFNKKIPFLFIQPKLLFDDWTRSVAKEIYHSISFIPLNLIYTDEISIKLIQELKNKQKIQLNSFKIQVLMRTNEIIWHKGDKTVEWSWMVTTVQVHWEQYWWISFTIHER